MWQEQMWPQVFRGTVKTASPVLEQPSTTLEVSKLQALGQVLMLKVPSSLGFGGSYSYHTLVTPPELPTN